MKTLFTCFFLFLSIFSFSQLNGDSIILFKIDSLKKSTYISKDDTNKVKTLFRIAVLYEDLLHLNPQFNDSVDHYLSKSEAFSRKINRQDVFAKRVLRYCIYINLYSDKANEDAVRKIKFCFRAVKIFSELKDSVNLADAYGRLSFLYSSIGDDLKVGHFSKKRLQILKKGKDYNLIMEAIESVGDSYYQINKFDSALVYYLDVFNKLKHIGPEEAKKQPNLFERKVSIVNGICELYAETGLNEKAISFYQENERLISSCSDSLEEQVYELVHSGRVIGKAYRKLKNHSAALNIFEKTQLRYITSIDEYHRSWDEMASLFLEYGLTYFEMNFYSNAIEKYIQGLKYADNNYSERSELLKALSEGYERNGDVNSALDIYKEYVNANDSMIIINNREGNIKQAALISSEFDFKNQMEIEQLENQKERLVSEEKSKKQKVIIWFTIAGLLIITVVSFFVFRNLLITRKQKKLIEFQKSEVECQKHIIEEKHLEITDSINYAERIQRSFLATKEQLDANLKDYFVLFQPKDVVSGDFYWSHQITNGNFIFVTADSTGHGVPGAIMSLLNTSSLEKAVELGITEPGEILNHTRQTIIERLKKDGSAEGGKDGMDCSLISFNKDKSKLVYAAANNPVWIIRNDNMIELSADKIPVGKHDRDSVSFTQHEVDLQKGDMIYTLTDGFPDQFGGPKGKKFMYKKLKEILVLISSMPLDQQNDFLKNSLKEWMGNTEQVDDITIIGIRV